MYNPRVAQNELDLFVRSGRPYSGRDLAPYAEQVGEIVVNTETGKIDINEFGDFDGGLEAEATDLPKSEGIRD